MRFSLTDKEAVKATGDTAVLFVFEGEQLRERFPNIILNDFKGKENSISVFYPPKSPKRIVLVGIGKKEGFHLNKLRNAVAAAVSYARQIEVKELSFSALKQGVSEEEAVPAIAESVIMADHKFDVFKSEKVNSKIESIIISAKRKNLQKQVDYASAVARNCVAARDMVNMSASLATPSYIADKAKSLCSSKIKCDIYSKRDLERMGANGILAVSSGSINEPRLVVLDYNPGKTRKTVALVGKGITFDSGGLSIKPASAMETMKSDMAVAVSVIHTVIAASELRLNVRVIGVMALAENVVGPLSYKPGDIIKTMSGKTVEVLNTDAEGRIILADALHFASSFNPDYTIDVATLAGACVVALGNEASGLMCNDSQLANMLKKSGEATYERVWELPMYDEYADLIISDFADLKNVVSNSPVPSGAGAITAAKFLQNFAKGKWAHIDIAGTSWADSEKGYKPKGATGVGVRLLAHFFSNL